MSEFSDSYHLRGPIELASDALSRARRRGVILPGARFTTVLVEQPEQGTDLHFIKAAGGVVLRWWYGEDHGVWCDLYEDGEALARLSAEWGPDFGVDADGNAVEGGTPRGDFDDEEWTRLHLLDSEQADAMRRLCLAAALEPRDVADEVAALLGIEHYRHLACNPAAVGPIPWEEQVAALLQRFPEALVVRDEEDGA